MKLNSKLSLMLLMLFIVTPDKKCFANYPQNHFINKSKILLVKQPEDRWLAIDKYQHFAVSAFLMGVSYNIAKVEGKLNRKNAILIGCSFSFSLGITKELRDYFHPKGVASFKDLVADVLGIGFGVLCFTDHLKF